MFIPLWVVPAIITLVACIAGFRFGMSDGDFSPAPIFGMGGALIVSLLAWLVYFIIV